MSCHKDPDTPSDMFDYIMRDCCYKCRMAIPPVGHCPGVDCTRCKTLRLAKKLASVICKNTPPTYRG